MANSGRMTTGTMVRLLQYGLDKIITHFDKAYLGELDKVFEKVSTEKGFYEFVQLAGMGPAAVKDEGDVTVYDSMNQDFGFHTPIITYGKSARITMEAIADNLYENLQERVAKDLIKAHNINDDLQAVYILNNASNGSVTWGDGVALLSTSHPLQAGGTNSNYITQDLSEDAIETAVNSIYGFYNPDGILGVYEPKNLVVPTALQFVARRIMGSPYKTSTANNDINVTYQQGYIKDLVVWRRLTSATTWFLTTDAEDGLLVVDRGGIMTKTYNEPGTEDVICYSRKRAAYLVGDHRCVLGSVGP